MAITVLSNYTAEGKDATVSHLNPAPGYQLLGPYTLSAAGGAGAAGDTYVLERPAFPVRVAEAYWQSTTDPAEALTLDIGWSKYDADAATVTEGDADFIVDGFDVDASATTRTALTLASTKHYSKATDYPDLVAKIATGASLTFAGVLWLYVEA